MEKIEAVWEKRNLGIECQELHCTNLDTEEELLENIASLTASYQVIRIPWGKTDLLLAAQRQGFSMIEATIGLSLKLKDPPVLPKLYQRFEKAVSIVPADSDQEELILSEIRSGTLFSTDRIALDPYFSETASGERYYQWTKDLILNRNGHLNCLQYKGETVGFSLDYPMDDRVYYAALGGIFKKYAQMGLGFLGIHGNNKSIYDHGGRIVETSVSSNNLPIFRLHQIFGYDTTTINYILIKHI